MRRNMRSYRNNSTRFYYYTVVSSWQEVRLVSEEYTLLFNAITDALETLETIRNNLIQAQQQAEEIWISK